MLLLLLLGVVAAKDDVSTASPTSMPNVSTASPTSMPTAAQHNAESDQNDFLREFYDLTSGSMWVNNSNWFAENTTYCDWYGLECAGKWVEKIDLESNGLGGPLPDKWERVPYLSSVRLSSNKILGTIPSSIGNLSLDSLLISHNDFTGTIPSSLGNLHASLLYLDDNRLTGTLPASVANNPLQGFTLDLNKMSGTVPEEFGNLGRQLMVISASFNTFTGTLPSGLCDANACNFMYNSQLGCPYESCKCAVDLCNCGNVCYSDNDCSGGSCSTCDKGAFGVMTCGGK